MSTALLSPAERLRLLVRLRIRAANQPPPNAVDLFRKATGEPDPWQVRVMRSQASRLLLLCSRQSGKSEVASVMATTQALAVAESLVLLVSPSLRQSGELFRKCLNVYRASGRRVADDDETKLTLELHNGSRLVSLPGTERTIRGYSKASLLLVDEAARVSDLLIAGVRPMLAVSGGRLVELSTPWGKRGHFYDAWEKGGDDWERYEVNAYQCPRISPAFLASEKRALGDLMFRSEYLVEFTDTEDQAFREADIDAMLDETLEPLWED